VICSYSSRAAGRGLVPQILADRVKYHAAAPWPIAADGIGPSLQRLNSAAYGNDPANWAGALPTPGGLMAEARRRSSAPSRFPKRWRST